jgi:hypothetical protein
MLLIVFTLLIAVALAYFLRCACTVGSRAAEDSEVVDWGPEVLGSDNDHRWRSADVVIGAPG